MLAMDMGAYIYMRKFGCQIIQQWASPWSFSNARDGYMYFRGTYLENRHRLAERRASLPYFIERTYICNCFPGLDIWQEYLLILDFN
jgi:hypothetical protein